MEHHSSWKKTVKLIILLILLAMGTAIYISCGEESLSPPPPPGMGTVRITGGAV